MGLILNSVSTNYNFSGELIGVNLDFRLIWFSDFY